MTEPITWVALHDINPEPWTSPSIAVVRAKSGRQVPKVYKGAQLRTFQEAVKAEIEIRYPDVERRQVGELNLAFWFWRRVAAGSARGRKQRANYADATNLQKATEDALQGILFGNDSQVKRITSRIMEQGEDVQPSIVIGITDDPEHIWQNPVKVTPPAPSESHERDRSDMPDLF